MKLHYSDDAHMKLRLPGTMKRLNVEHRTPNIDRRILMTLRFIDFKTSEPQNIEGMRNGFNFYFKDKNPLLFFCCPSSFNIRYSLFTQSL